MAAYFGAVSRCSPREHGDTARERTARERLPTGAIALDMRAGQRYNHEAVF